jgi:hypothetical protein
MRGIITAVLAAAAAPLSAQGVPVPAQQQPADPFVAADAKATVEALAVALDENFVFPDKGKAYAAMLRANLAAGAYDSFADARAFAERVSADLQAVHEDGHLRLRVVPVADRGGPQASVGQAGPTGNAVSKAGWLAPGVAYIAFDMFPGNAATLADVRKFLDEHKDAESLVIDGRKHRGGGLAEMDLIFAEIFDKPTALVMMDTRRVTEERRGNPFGEAASLKLVPASQDVVRRVHSALPNSKATRLRSAKVYYLTAKRTTSAAEHLALALKRTGRATLIGETTGGAGHYGGMVPMGSIYAAFIPVGRTFDPDTNQGWEGTGVAPDVAVAADAALGEALKRAGVGVTGAAALASLK